MKHGTQHYFVYLIVLEWLELKTIVMCLKLRAKLRFKGFLSIFGTFSDKVVQIWFVWHKTWFTTVLGTCYCVEIVRIENDSYILQIIC